MTCHYAVSILICNALFFVQNPSSRLTKILPLQMDKDAIRKQFFPHKVFFVSAKQKTGIEELLVHLRSEYNQYCKIVQSKQLKAKEE